MSHFTLREITTPDPEPLTTALAKQHLKVDISDDDDYIDALVKACRQRLERDANLALITQTLEMTYDCFPWDGSAMKLLRSPLQSVTSIKYIDTDGVEQTWASDQYRVDTASKPARITPAFGVSYPSIRAVTGAVIVRYDAGYGDAASDIPEDLINAIKFLLGHLYENREDVVIGTITSKVPNAYKWLKELHQVTF